MQPELAVVIPAFNEAHRIGEALRANLSWLAEHRPHATVIVVDDGSTDRTSPVARTALSRHPELRSRVVRHQPNAGKGAAIVRGFDCACNHIRCPRVLLTDADFSTPLSELPKLERALDAGAELACGSRATGDTRVDARAHRVAAGVLFRAALRLMGLGVIRDTQCGFKLYSPRAARLCARFSQEQGFAFDLEHLGLCERAGLGIREIGVEWTHAEGGSVRPLRDGPRMIYQARHIRHRLARLDPAGLRAAITPEPEAQQPDGPETGPPEVVVRPDARDPSRPLSRSQ
ncbi:MAG: glycosyltransferase [Planctomycetota bacterium]